MKNKTILICTILVLAMIVVMAGCAGGKGGNSGPVDIVIGEPGQSDQEEQPAQEEQTGQAEPGSASGSGGPNVPDLRLVSYINAPYVENMLGGYYYEYDAQNRLVKVTAESDMNEGVWEVTYPSENTVHYENTEYQFYFTLTLDPDTGVVTHYEGNPGGMAITQELEYEDGYLIRTTSSAPMKSVNDYIWSDGQLDTIEINVMGMNIKTSFTYGDIPNVACSISPWITSHQKNWYTPTYFCGNMSPYLVMSEVQELEGKKIDYRYETDANGYVTFVYQSVNGGAETLLYEVQYKK